MNVRKMDASTKALSQMLRGFERLDRHLGEIDWDKNVSNAE